MRYRKDDVRLACLFHPSKDGKVLRSLEWRTSHPVIAHTDRWASEVVGYVTNIRVAQQPPKLYGDETVPWVLCDLACETDPQGLALSPIVTLDVSRQPFGRIEVTTLSGTLHTVAVVETSRAPWDGMVIR